MTLKELIDKFYTELRVETDLSTKECLEQSQKHAQIAIGLSTENTKLQARIQELENWIKNAEYSDNVPGGCYTDAMSCNYNGVTGSEILNQ